MYKYVFLTVIFVLLFFLSINYGGSDLSLAEALSNEEYAEVFWDIRLPRVLNAILVGCLLAVSGVAFQAVFLNPLVSPDLLGA